MARRFRRSEPMRSMSEINVTSLLDLAFCLLIIFMISTPLIEANNSNQQQIPLNLPTESTKEQPVRQEIKYQTISIDTVGRIFWGQRQTDMEELDRLLENLAREEPSPVISLRADRTIPYQRVISVLDKIQAHGLNQISLETQAQ
jgi:biopolymer transport protein ExbD